MALRNIKITLHDQSYDNDDIVTDFLFVPSKLKDGEIKIIINKLLDQLHSGEIPYAEVREQVVKRLSEDVSSSSYKEINFTIDFGSE